MKTSPSHSKPAGVVARNARSSHRRHPRPKVTPQVPKRWNWHYRVLSQLRDRLFEERHTARLEAAEPIERHSMHQADSATDEFDHELALSQLSIEQDALYEVEAAMRRILGGTYGICEQSGKRIPSPRLRAVPWTRFREGVEARLEGTGEIPRPHLGTLRSVRDEPSTALAEYEPTVEEPKHVLPTDEALESLSSDTNPSSRKAGKSRKRYPGQK